MKKLTELTTALYLICSLYSGLQGQHNIGIGTVAPAYLLDVQGDPGSTLLTNINSKVNYAGALDIKAIEGNSVTADGYGIGGRFTGGYRGIEGICQGGAYSGGTYGVYGFATGTAGTRYGIYGTATGGQYNIGLYGIVTGGSGNYGVYGSNLNLSGYAGYFNGRGYFSEELHAHKNMLVDDNLGIGTLTPETRLHIPAGNDASYTTNGFIQTGITNGWNMVIDDNEILARNNGAGNDMFIQRDGGDLLLCALELGAVGVGLTAGTSIPNGYIFAVDGKIISEELRIQNSNNWPDYVFSDQYALMPLDALKQSIRQNKHLPDIPSAETVEKDGILIGDMQKKMMEKIEQLTLYVIDLHETINEQEKEIEQQRTELEQLKNK